MTFFTTFRWGGIGRAFLVLISLQFGLFTGSALGAPSVQIRQALPDVAERAVQGVVNISSQVKRKGRQYSQDPFLRHFFRGHPQTQRRGGSLGSGVLVDEAGTVLTNHHVIEGADEIKVTLADGREFTAAVVGADPKSDLAVIRVESRGRSIVTDRSER